MVLSGDSAYILTCSIPSIFFISEVKISRSFSPKKMKHHNTPPKNKKNNVTANFLPPRIFNSKLLQYPKAKVILSCGSDCVDLMLICQRC